MKYAIIENDIVVNVIEAPEDFTLEGRHLVRSDDAAIGYRFDGETGTFTSPVPIDVPDPDEQQRKKLLSEFGAAVQAHLDAAARERNYDGALSLATYTASLRPVWAAEARAFIKWRDDVWVYALAELDKAQNGERAIPTVEEFIAELPAMRWPDAAPVSTARARAD